MFAQRILTGFKSLVLFGILVLGVFAPGHVFAELTEQEKNIALAKVLYNDMNSIAKAVEAYRVQHKVAPDSVDQLLAGAFLESIPVMGEEFGGGAYLIQKGYGNMDGRGKKDDVIYSGENIPEAICVEFNKLYAQAPLNNGTVFDYAAAGRKYPGEVYGRKMKVFAIKWESYLKVCEIDWVIDYN